MIITKQDTFVANAKLTKEEMVAIRTILMRDMINNGPTLVSPGIDSTYIIDTLGEAIN